MCLGTGTQKINKEKDMTEMGEKLARILSLAAAPKVDVPNLMMLVAEAVLLERERAVAILEAPMESLRKKATAVDQSGGDSGSVRDKLQTLVDMRDKISDGSGYSAQ
jgi:hypothetical protein